jgi:glyoxylase-like metal-dependent hydrolase (beta-lactamase superfamily II)
MARTITPLAGNGQKLDGGSMFGNCPRVVWERWMPPDEQGRVPLACRAMLVEEEGRRLLFETGIGAFFPPALKERYGVVESDHVLLASLAAHGLEDADVDVVVLSHLHFDHAGGLLAAWAEGAPPRLLFPRARFVVGRTAFERARRPHPRDRASFIPELPGLLEESGRLTLVEGGDAGVLGPGYRFHLSDGHTPGLLMTEVETDAGPLVFVGDLIPGAPWMRVSLSMGYDRYPELLVDEKRALLEDLLARGGSVFFTHDPSRALARVARDERGRFVAA